MTSGEDESLPDVDGGIYITMPMLLRIRGRRRSLTFTMETLQHAVHGRSQTLCLDTALRSELLVRTANTHVDQFLLARGAFLTSEVFVHGKDGASMNRAQTMFQATLRSRSITKTADRRLSLGSSSWESYQNEA